MGLVVSEVFVTGIVKKLAVVTFNSKQTGNHNLQHMSTIVTKNTVRPDRSPVCEMSSIHVIDDVWIYSSSIGVMCSINRRNEL